MFHPADVLHIVDNSNAWYSFTARYNQFVVTVHDMIPWKCANGMIEGWNPSRAARAVLRLNLAALHRADLIIAVSETTRRDLLAAGYDESRIRLIHNCNLTPPLAGQGDRWDGLDLGTTFVHFGAGKYPKHSELVVEAFGETVLRMPSARLILVGPGASRLAATVGTAAAVQAYDQISSAEVQYLYEHVAAVLMPSRYEGFGLPVLEAQESSCLIITSNGGALDEVMQDGPLKLARPIKAAELSGAMIRVLTDESFRKIMRQEGQLNAARFSRANAEAGYVDLYEKICGEGKR